MNKIINSIKIGFSIIGAVIGAGFISGREIMKFFYGKNLIISVSVVFLSLFTFIYIILKIDDKKTSWLIEKSTALIYLFNVLIMASMFSATQSLATQLLPIKYLPSVIPIAIAGISTWICFNGIDKLESVNSILIPVMMVVFFIAVIFTYNRENIYIADNVFSIDVVSYASMNIFLAQPFLLNVKKEKNKFSPFFVAFFSAIILSVAIFAFLLILSDDCLNCDIPLIYLTKNSSFLSALITIIVFLSILTTVISVQFPFGCILKNKFSCVPMVIVTVIAFAISKIGFYMIVDKVYPVIAIISLLYYAIIAILWLIFQAGRLKSTLNLQARIGGQY